MPNDKLSVMNIPVKNETTGEITNKSLDLKDADIPSWARAETKPAYTASEVGAVSTVASQGLSDTEKSNARANIGAGTSNFSGNYNDLSNKPSIPTVNNATLTIQKNGTNVQTFTANQGSNATANITVPTKVSELTNDSGYTTNTGTVNSVKCNGVTQTISSGAVNIDVATNLVTEAQWTQIQALLS